MSNFQQDGNKSNTSKRLVNKRETKVEITELKKEDERLWDEYVFRSDQSTFYHQLGWRNVVQKTYGHKPIYLVAKEDEEIKGILPMFLMKSRIFGKKIVSVPFAPYGGVCADSEEVESELVKEAKGIADEFDVDYLELRYLGRCDNGNLATNDKYTTFILELNKDPDVVWRNKFNNKVRNAIRKSYKSNLKFVDCGLKEFYRIYTKNMKHLGTPSHSYTFFESLIKEFSRKVFSSGVIHNGATIASTLLLSFKDTLVSGWAASDREYSMLNPNNFLYWEVIKLACNNGYRYFDFGRSLLNSGTFRFKKPWGGKNIKLYYNYYIKKGLLDTTQSNPKRRKFAKIWSRMPHFLAWNFGPLLRKNIP